MKRTLIRLSILAGIVAVGAIAIAQAQRLGEPTLAPAQPRPALSALPSALPAATGDTTPSTDPFAAAEARYSDRGVANQTSGTSLGFVPSAPATPAVALEPPTATDEGTIPHAHEVLPVPRALPDSATAEPLAAQPMPADPFAGEPLAVDPRDPYPPPSQQPPSRNSLREPSPAEPYAPAVADRPDPFLQPAPSGSAIADDPFAQPTAPSPTPAAEYAPRDVGRSTPAAPNYSQNAPPAELRYAESRPLAPTPATGPPSASGGSTGTGRPGNRQLEGAQSPALLLEKVAPAETQVGKPTRIELVVRNAGGVPALEVEVADAVPEGCQLVGTTPLAQRGPRGELVWRVGTIAPGDEVRLSMDMMPQAEGEVGSVAQVRWAAQATSRTTVTRPELTLAVQAPREVLVGEDALLQIKLTNTGTGMATGVMLSEVVPPQFEHPAGNELELEIGQLAPGESRVMDLALRAVRPGQVQNTLVATGEGRLHAQAQSTLQVVAPDLQVALQGPRRRYLDRQASYTVVVTNPGTAAAREVELVTYLPRGMQFVEANNAGQYDPQTHAVYWLLEELPARETGTAVLVATPTEAGEQVLRVEGTAQRGLNARHEEKVLVEGVAAILFQVADTFDPIELGGETEYEVRVVNQGSKEATNVQVAVLLPPELQPLGAEGATRWQAQGNQIRFEALPALAPKAESVFRIKAKAIAAGDLRVRVQLLSDDLRTPVTKEESTRVFAD